MKDLQTRSKSLWLHYDCYHDEKFKILPRKHRQILPSDSLDFRGPKDQHGRSDAQRSTAYHMSYPLLAARQIEPCLECELQLEKVRLCRTDGFISGSLFVLFVEHVIS
jgi:hypothetical protein